MIRSKSARNSVGRVCVLYTQCRRFDPYRADKMKNLKKVKTNIKGKPSFLYHASLKKDLKEIEVRLESRRDEEEGDVVFATPDLALAGAFLTGFSDSWANLGKINGIPYFVIGDKDKFLESDNGGAIYKLDSSSFEFDADKGMGEDEWTSRKNVKPVEITKVNSNLDFMLDNGLQVYFFEKDKFESWQEILKTGDTDKMIEVLKSEVSENQKRGKNIKEFK